MRLLNKVNEMKEQGLSEEQVSQQLREQGNNANEINTALEQSKIKSAISMEAISAPSPEGIPQPPTEQSHSQPMTSEISEGGVTGMQPSISTQQPPAQAPTEQIPPQPLQQEQAPAYPPYQETAPQIQQPEIASGEQYIPQAELPPEYDSYEPYMSTTSETMNDVAEQITDEKIMKLKKEIGNVENFKEEVASKVDDLNERLKKIESIIEKLEVDIIGKIGSYGENIENIKDEMGMMQDSFSKALNPLLDKASEKSHPTKTRKPSKKKSDGFEHYLR